MFNIKVKDDDESILKSMKVCVQETTLPETPREEYGFEQILNQHRNKIDKIDPEVWKKVRWYINDYDFLVKDPIINRAFYKYWEIINVFNVFEAFDESDCIFHCAEAPGGFIQGSNIYLQLSDNNNNIKHVNKDIDKDGFMTVKKKRVEKVYKIFTISLNKDLPRYKNYNLPSYNKRVINKNVYVTFGKDNTGDINNVENVEYIKRLVGDGCYLVTADGGFDEGTDFNNKEQLHFPLILNEIYSAICLQKPSGIFILKVFDIFTSTSIQLIYLLNLIYNEVYIYKPKTSRPTNSEKYIICKNFCMKKSIQSDVLEKLKTLSEKLKLNKDKYSSFTLFDNIPTNFITNIKRMNKHLLDVQSEYLSKAIDLCEDDVFVKRYERELNDSLDKRREIFKKWEKRYNLGYYVPS